MTRAMNAALTTKQSAGKQAAEPPPAASRPMIGVKRAAPDRAGGDGASSSDEDSSDEAYAGRHAPWELEERTRFMTYQTGTWPGATCFVSGSYRNSGSFSLWRSLRHGISDYLSHGTRQVSEHALPARTACASVKQASAKKQW